MLKLCVIIFAQNETESLFNTFNRILTISQDEKMRGVIQEVFVIDDGSETKNQKIISAFFNDFKLKTEFDLYFLSQNPKGISKTVSETLAKSKDNVNSVLPLPGHDMFDTNSIYKLIESSAADELSIGFRSNLWSERPILKYISAKILTLFYRLLVFPKIIDAHGLYIFPIEIARKYISPHGGHEILILPLYMALKNGVKVNQIPINLKEGHLVESYRLGRSKRTRLPHIISSIKCLTLIIKDKFNLS